MSGTVRHFGRIKDGKKRYYKPTVHEEAMKALEGKEFMEILEERFVDTTTDQHGYYRATNRWLIENAEKFGGWSEDEVHHFAASLFLTHRKMIDYGGIPKELIIVESTADLGKKKMRIFIDQWTSWLALHESIVVPEPAEMVVGKYRSESKK